jgi:glyoxylase-like metal-dependent hydrolase (beta-lactamase superfamily II)
VTPNLYVARSGTGVDAQTVFLVTPEGIILADPLSPEFSAWLKGELAMRFPGLSVKWVVHSHYHYDHARGGGMFADSARFVGHENMQRNLRLPIAQAPPPGDSTDRDGDDQLAKDETPIRIRAAFDRYDEDGNGFVSRAEMDADIRWPGVVFKDEYTITLGGKQARLIWAKNRHTNDMLDIYFPDERVLFAGDYVWINRMCCGFSFDRRPIQTWIDSLKSLEALDFDILVNSHFDSGRKADLVAFRMWLEDLQSAVAAGIKEGRTLQELQKSVTLDKYKSWAGYEAQRQGIIQSAYISLTKYGAN